MVATYLKLFLYLILETEEGNGLRSFDSIQCVLQSDFAVEQGPQN